MRRKMRRKRERGGRGGGGRVYRSWKRIFFLSTSFLAGALSSSAYLILTIVYLSTAECLNNSYSHKKWWKCCKQEQYSYNESTEVQTLGVIRIQL